MLKKSIRVVFASFMLVLGMSNLFAQGPGPGEILYLYDDEVQVHLDPDASSEVLTTLERGHRVQVKEVGEPIKSGYYQFSWIHVEVRVGEQNKMWTGWIWSEHIADAISAEDWNGDGEWEMLMVRNRTFNSFRDYNLPFDQSKLEFQLVQNSKVSQKWEKNIQDVQDVQVEYRPMINGFEPTFNAIYLSFSRATDADRRIEDSYFYSIAEEQAEPLTEALHYWSILEENYTMEQIPLFPGDPGIRKNQVKIKVEITKDGAWIDEETSDEVIYTWDGTVFHEKKRN